jgi:predicted RecA/RadA family phage recombinase
LKTKKQEIEKMSTKYKAPGQIIELTAPEAISADEVVKVGQIIGMSVAAAANGEKVQVAVEGIFEFPCASAADIAVGDLLYWDAADDELNKTASGNTLVGYAVSAAGNGVTAVDVKLTGQANADGA